MLVAFSVLLVFLSVSLAILSVYFYRLSLSVDFLFLKTNVDKNLIGLLTASSPEWISKDWERVACCLGCTRCTERHTSANISAKIVVRPVFWG